MDAINYLSLLKVYGRSKEKTYLTDVSNFINELWQSTYVIRLYVVKFLTSACEFKLHRLKFMLYSERTSAVSLNSKTRHAI